MDAPEKNLHPSLSQLPATLSVAVTATQAVSDNLELLSRFRRCGQILQRPEMKGLRPERVASPPQASIHASIKPLRQRCAQRIAPSTPLQSSFIYKAAVPDPMAIAKPRRGRCPVVVQPLRTPTNVFACETASVSVCLTELEPLRILARASRLSLPLQLPSSGWSRSCCTDGMHRWRSRRLVQDSVLSIETPARGPQRSWRELIAPASVQREREAALAAGQRGLLRTVAVSRPLTSFVRCHDLAGRPPSHDVPPTATCPRPPSQAALRPERAEHFTVGSHIAHRPRQHTIGSLPAARAASHGLDRSCMACIGWGVAPTAFCSPAALWKWTGAGDFMHRIPGGSQRAEGGSLPPKAKLCVPDAISHGPQPRARANSLAQHARIVEECHCSRMYAGCQTPSCPGPSAPPAPGACRLPAPAAVEVWTWVRGGCVEAADAGALPWTAPTCPLDPAQTVPSAATAAC
ncbi:uncharacterized protein BDZ99DRAFT_526210 [Mytilinidion resinicola]|uniref:Uncharacterized protein n=1 Tax=Mytilinidion resinicola TaxID=574789 RepID=A0A6A6Y6T7_9PEZI|nr:uncharacterized protein BDZ99DRAFT_526210 [Mytilinidion resinicola]KAF2803734.1 hypothetical protein BDZ99DRAFT_526210 [Mytilinidion resinicola]